MKPKRIAATFKFRSEDLQSWRDQATADNRSLTNWIEVACNAWKIYQTSRRDRESKGFQSIETVYMNNHKPE